jgi:large subunit ribosomal protein L29
MAKAGEFRELGVEELQQRVTELDGELFTLRMQKAMGQLDKPVKLREVRRDLARIKTVLREKAGQ